MKTCIKCNTLLHTENTYIYNVKNHIHKCKNCTKQEKAKWGREYVKKNKDKIKENSNRYLKTLKENNPKKYKAKEMVSSSKKRAIKKQILNDIDSEYILKLCVDYCPIMGVKLNYHSTNKGKDAPSLDRIDPSKGYIKGNVQIISYIANLMKSNASNEELKTFAKWVINNLS